MNNWRLLLFAFVAVLLPVGSFTERNLFHGREKCCDHRSDYPETGLHGTYRKSTQDQRLSSPLQADRFDTRDSRRHETRYGNPLTDSDRVSVERRFAESVRSQEHQKRNLPESRLSRVASSRRDLTRNDRESVDSTRRNTLDNTRSERRTRDVDLNRNYRTENERRMSVRTERNEIRKDTRPSEESIRHELRLKNERIVLRLRESLRERQFRISKERREQMTSNAERRQINQQRDTRDSVERRETRNVERVAQDELERKRVRVMQLSRVQQQRSDNRQSRDREFSVLRENVRREEQKRLLRDPLDSGALRMREIRSLERLERVRDSLDIRIEARSNERLERTSERSRVSEDRNTRGRESRKAEPRRTASFSRVENSRQRLETPQLSNVRKDDRLKVRNRGIEKRNSVRKDSEMSRRSEVADRAERNYESERRIINAHRQIERIDSRISQERRETPRMLREDSTRAQIVPTRVHTQDERTRDVAREIRERSDIRNVRNSETVRDLRDRSESRTDFQLNRERSSLERSRNLNARNTLSSVRNIEREVVRNRRSLDNRADSRGENKLSRERLSLERSRNLNNILPSTRNVRDIEREVSRTRRSVDDRVDTRREYRLSQERSPMERNRNVDSRNTRSEVRNVRELRDNQREVTRDQRSVNRIDTRRESTNLDRSRSLEARNERESRNRAVRNERQTQREYTERLMAIRPQIDRLAMERNDRTLASRNGNQADLFRVRENMINEKTESQDGMNWQNLFYTLQGAYLCGLIVQMLTENSMKSKSRNFSWWLPASNNQIKVD